MEESDYFFVEELNMEKGGMCYGVGAYTLETL